MFNWIDSIGARNNATSDHVTAPAAPGFNSNVNPQYDGRYHAAAIVIQMFPSPFHFLHIRNNKELRAWINTPL